MKISARLAIAATAAALALAGCASAHNSASPAGHTPSALVPSTPATSAAPTPDPKGTYTGSCNYTLASNPSGTDWLTGEVDLTNTGNIGTVVRVVIKWPQEGFAPIRAERTVHTAAGATKAVSFHVSAGSIDGNSNVISNLQAWESGHNYPSDDCTYKTTIISTFGSVQ